MFLIDVPGDIACFNAQSQMFYSSHVLSQRKMCNYHRRNEHEVSASASIVGNPVLTMHHSADEVTADTAANVL